ncbi:MAG: HAD hydrolase family protein, partial [Chitinispirillia bacterium]
NRKQNRDPRLNRGLKIADIMNIAWIGITIIDGKAKLELFRKEIVSIFENIYTNITESLQTPGFKWFTLNSANANKSDAILSLKKYLDIHDHYTVVFGDQPIDIPMFNVSDLSVAVENAHPSVKGCADVIIGNNDSDAVVDFIESHYYQYE